MAEFAEKDRYTLEDFREIMKILRAPGGCPWDAAQTHESVRNNLLEEAYELAAAIDHNDAENMKEELGDVLMQVIFHSLMEEEKGSFTLDDVADAAVRKLIFRHPHVFGEIRAASAEEALDRWESVKRVEKKQESTAAAMSDVAETLPALWRAAKVQKKAAKVGFDWPDVTGALEKIREETEELCQAIEKDDAGNMEEELGDLLFATVNAARFLKVDPEKALHKSCEKFIRRFRLMEDTVLREGKRPEEMSLDELEAVYQAVRHRADQEV